MTIAVDPLLVSLGPYAVRWSGALALAGLALGVWSTQRVATARGLPGQAVLDAAAWALPLGVLGGRLGHLAAWWEYYLQHPAEIVTIPLAGLSLWPALLAGGLAAAWRLRGDRRIRARIADASATGLALGIALGRIGQLLDGSGQGVPASLPWATQYANPAAATPDFGVPRHPAQAYDLLGVLVALAVAQAVPRTAPPGRQFCTFLALYGAARVLFGPVRLDPIFLLGLQLDQLIAGGAALLAVLLAARSRSGLLRPPEAATPAGG